MRTRHLKERLAHPPSVEPVGETKIKSMLPLEGEWFCLQIKYDSPELPRLFLSRLVVWALVEDDCRIDSVKGIDGTGIPHEDTLTDVYYIYGADLSPNGNPWSDVYRSVKSSLYPLREVTHLFAGQHI